MTEILIVLGLIAIAGILVAVLFGDNIRKQMGKSGNAVGGKKTADVFDTKAVNKEADEKDLSNFADDAGSNSAALPPSSPPPEPPAPPDPPPAPEPPSPPEPPVPPDEWDAWTSAPYWHFKINMPNITFNYKLVGTDGYVKTGIATTNANGEMSIQIPPGGANVKDTMVVWSDQWGAGASKSWTFVY